jgi:NADH:ubiquinone oxidoreductase subunit 4 (subunit M)
MVLGFMLLFISVIAPTVFTVLDESNAGLLLRKFFPRMFLFGFAIIFLAIIAAVQSDRFDLISLSSISALGFLFNAFYLAPLINKKRNELNENPDASSAGFKLAHGFSVSIFISQLIISLTCLAMVHHPII